MLGTFLKIISEDPGIGEHLLNDFCHVLLVQTFDLLCDGRTRGDVAILIRVVDRFNCLLDNITEISSALLLDCRVKRRCTGWTGHCRLISLNKSGAAEKHLILADRGSCNGILLFGLISNFVLNHNLLNLLGLFLVLLVQIDLNAFLLYFLKLTK